MCAKTKTVETMKKKREVPAGLRDKVKRWNAAKKEVLAALEDGPATVPEIAERTGRPPAEVTWHLMTLRKFGDIETDRADEMDEFYYYRKKG